MDIKNKIRYSLLLVGAIFIFQTQFVSAESNYSENARYLFFLTTAGSIVVGLVVFALLLFLVMKYKESKDFTRNRITNEKKYELIWVFFAIFLSVILIVASTPILLDIQNPSASNTENAIDLHIEASQFAWSVAIGDGNATKGMYDPTIHNIRLKVNQNYKMILTAKGSAIHSFFSFDLSIKLDAVPGQVNTMYFKITEAGEYIVTCTEYCGVNHYMMQFKIIAEV